MSRSPGRKAAVLQELMGEVRRMSAQSVLVSTAIAERVGLSSSDLECLDLIVMAAGEGGATPGQLASQTGLTSGAITGVVDRLEEAGAVRRDADPADRRKVRIVAVESRVRQIGVYYEHLGKRIDALWSQFTEEQLATILEFTRRSTEITAEEIAHIRMLPPLKPAKGSS